MSKYFLRVDAVNLNQFVYDTHDISTIRGGSFLLLDAIEGLAEQFKDRLQRVTHAASQGIYRFEADQPDDPICREILNYLHRQTGGHATFLLAVQPEIPGHFEQVLEKLEAQIHRQQWRMPTVTIPRPAPQAAKECYLDGWRPGSVPYQVAPSLAGAWVSAATDFRRRKGGELRQNLMLKILGYPQTTRPMFTNDLGELAADPARGVLNGKIAVWHVDGNGFGAIRRSHCKTVEDRTAFDAAIQEFRTKFLKKLLQCAMKDPAFQALDAQGNQVIRLEVLLWGGDEMTLVAPAWVGWKVARIFYESAKELKFKDKDLSHRGALIFCHHDAPILFIRQLAEDLLERTKKDIRKKLTAAGNFAGYDHAAGNSLHYLVLESFDLLQGSLNAFLSNYYRGVDYADLLVSAQEFNDLLPAMSAVQSLLARGKAIEGIQRIQKMDAGASEVIRKLPPKLPTPEDRAHLNQAVEQLLKDGMARWYWVTDLWDYPVEENTP